MSGWSHSSGSDRVGAKLADGMASELVIFARNLKSAREAARLSQQDLADRAQLARSHVSSLERGLINPSLVTMADLAKALDCRLVDLLHDSAGTSPAPEPIALNAVRSIVGMLRESGLIDSQP